MEQKSDNKDLAVLPGWTKREMELLNETVSNGIKPIAPTLAAQMYNLFAEGYSCSEIAKQNKGFNEGDILYCRQRFKWDDQRDEYALHLTNLVQQRMLKQKMESVEYLTNMLSVIHKADKDLMLKFLQTGNIDDLPKIGSLRTYKDIVETLAKITGESNIKKLKIDGRIEQETTIRNEGASPIQIAPELQTKLLELLAKESELIGAKGMKPSE